MENIRSVIIFFSIVIAVLTASALGVFRLPDQMLYDEFVDVTPTLNVASSKILLIEAGEDGRQLDGQVWIKLLQTVSKMQPRQVLFLFLPRDDSKAFYEKAKQQGNVFFGREVTLEHPITSEPVLEMMPPGIGENDVTWGVVTRPPSYHGVYRSYYTSIDLDGKRLRTLENAAAGLSRELEDTLPNPFLINFNGTYHGLPKMSLNRFFAGEAIPNLVRGRTLVVGLAEPYQDAGIYTPISESRPLSLLEFHGHVLDTLLSRKVITEPSGMEKSFWLVGVVLIALLFPQFLNARLFFATLIVLSVIYFCIAWVFLSYLYVWLPLTELMFAHLCVSFLVFRRITVLQDLSTDKMLIDASVTLQDRVAPESFFVSHEYWTQVITMINQTLDLNRVIFLEKVPGDHRVREVKSLNCAFADIHERRRDYTREPYSSALSEGGPIRTDNRLFLQKAETNEIQYLVPLLFGGDIMGFWAFGIEEERIENVPNFDTVIKNFGNQIAEMLFQRQQKMKRTSDEHKTFMRYLRMEGHDDVHRNLTQSLALIDHRLSMVESLLSGLGTAIALYDLFGRVLYVNKNMTELLKNSGFLPYEMTAMDLVSGITDLSLSRIREYFRTIILEQRSISLPGQLPGNTTKSYVLDIHPLSAGEDTRSKDDAVPFRVHGLLFEMTDVTSLRRLNRLKEQLVEKVSYQIRHDLEPIILGLSILEDRSFSEEERSTVSKHIQGKVSRVLSFIKNAQEELRRDIYAGTVEQYPVDLKEPVTVAVEALKPKVSPRGITFDIHMPKVMNLVCAGPEALTEVFKSILAVLVHDAIDGSQVALNLEESDHSVVIQCSNRGFGMPNNIFQQYLFEDEEAVSDEFKDFRSAILQIRRWGGTISASSTVGVGIVITANLKPSISCEVN